jgi:hypothetical protein
MILGEKMRFLLELTVMVEDVCQGPRGDGGALWQRKGSGPRIDISPRLALADVEQAGQLNGL